MIVWEVGLPFVECRSLNEWGGWSEMEGGMEEGREGERGREREGRTKVLNEAVKKARREPVSGIFTEIQKI